MNDRETFPEKDRMFYHPSVDGHFDQEFPTPADLAAEEEDMFKFLEELGTHGMNTTEQLSAQKRDEEQIIKKALEEDIEVFPIGLTSQMCVLEKISAFDSFLQLDAERRRRERIAAILAEATHCNDNDVVPPPPPVE